MKTIPAAGNPEKAAATVREIAALAGVSLMTVSRALRNQPRVAEATRRKVLKIAERVGYRPDPEIAKLMHYMRTGKRLPFRSVIWGLTNWPTKERPAYFQALLAGAERQARVRGYAFVSERWPAESRAGAALWHVMRSRGVQGVLLLPQNPPVDLSGRLDWSEFSVVAASLSVLGPEMNRVAPNHFLNTIRLCREVSALGYRRIGLVIAAAQEARVQHVFSAAVELYAKHEATEAVAPLVFEGKLQAPLRAWFQRERPDVIVATDESWALECARILQLKIPGPIGLAITSMPQPSGRLPVIGGIDERPGDLGAIAVDLLAAGIERRVRGLPESPTSTLLAGRWRAGQSCPVRVVR